MIMPKFKPQRPLTKKRFEALLTKASTPISEWKHDSWKHGNQYGTYRYCRRCNKRELVSTKPIWFSSLTEALNKNRGIEIVKN
jgi:hypothetical protein